MADFRGRPGAAASSAGHLLVLERPLTGASAAHALRLALARCRRGERVTVYLTETALSPAAESTAIHPLQELLFSGGRVLAELAVMGSASALGCTSGIERASEHDLAALLLMPGVDARWC